MTKYDVVMLAERGNVHATLEAEEGIPTGLLLQAVMSHQQVVPHMVQLDANAARTLMISTPSRLEVPRGITVVFPDGVNINGPLNPSPVANVPTEFEGVKLTSNMAVAVVYNVEPDDDDGGDDDFWTHGVPDSATSN
jgi:hypothetical protein